MEGGNQENSEQASPADTSDSIDKTDSGTEEEAEERHHSSSEAPSSLAATAVDDHDVWQPSKDVEPAVVISEKNNPKEPEPVKPVGAAPVKQTNVKRVVNGIRDRNEPFEPWYKVQVAGAVKDGENVIFKLNTTKLEVSRETSEVERIYEDFEWLHHCLVTENDIGGIVIPPLPLKPAASAADSVAKSRKELGDDSKTIKGDEFEKDIRRLQRYTQSIVRHPVLGRDIVLAKFLTEKDPPVRAKLKKNMFSNLSKALEGALKGSHQDVDEMFQKNRLNASNLVPLAKDMSATFHGTVNHTQRLSGALNHFATALCLVSNANASRHATQMNEMHLTFARSMEHLSHALDVYMTNDENTLGFTLELYSKYAESVKEMLIRRTIKLYEFDSAVKALEKAKPLKKPAAEELKNQREAEFEEISQIATIELTQYKQHRIIDYQQALVLYAEAKIKTARDAYALLAKDLSSIKTMELDGS